MTPAPSLEFITVANPFAALMDLPSCMEAHERLSRLPQQSHRPMDKPTPARDLGRHASDEAGPHDFGVVVTEFGDVDPGSPPVVRDTSDILRINEVELLG
jgi:hypothetical protein